MNVMEIKVGDSILYKRVGLIGIVTDKRYVKVLDDTMYTIAWMDGEMSNNLLDSSAGIVDLACFSG